MVAEYNFGYEIIKKNEKYILDELYIKLENLFNIDKASGKISRAFLLMLLKFPCILELTNFRTNPHWNLTAFLDTFSKIIPWPSTKKCNEIICFLKWG